MHRLFLWTMSEHFVAGADGFGGRLTDDVAQKQKIRHIAGQAKPMRANQHPYTSFLKVMG